MACNCVLKSSFLVEMFYFNMLLHFIYLLMMFILVSKTDLYAYILKVIFIYSIVFFVSRSSFRQSCIPSWYIKKLKNLIFFLKKGLHIRSTKLPYVLDVTTIIFLFFEQNINSHQRNVIAITFMVLKLILNVTLVGN